MGMHMHHRNSDLFIGWGCLISKGLTKKNLGSMTPNLVSNQLEIMTSRLHNISRFLRWMNERCACMQ